MGETSRTFTINLGSGSGSALEAAANGLAKGQYVEFNTNQNTWAKNGDEQSVYWTHKFYWDEINREAQGIWIGVYYSPVTHVRYIDAEDGWVSTTPLMDPKTYWEYTHPYNPGDVMRGHPFEWHALLPDGTYLVKRSEERAFQYRKRADWSIDPWLPSYRTPVYVAPNSMLNWPESVEYHEAMGRLLTRWGVTVMSIDMDGFLATGAWNYANIINDSSPVKPGITASVGGVGTVDKCSMRYCRALRSMVCFGYNFGSVQDSQYLIRPDGSCEQMAQKPPRWVMNGNYTMTSTDIDKYGIFIDDPLKQSAYIIERQPSSSGKLSRVWKMRNTGESWDGTWDEIEVTGLMIAPRSDNKSIGTRQAFAPVTNYGCIWMLRQRNDDGGLNRVDSFIWKPAA